VVFWLSILCGSVLSVFAAMDRLSSDQQELLRKNSTERLRLKLTRVGWEEDSVFAMDRTELLRAAADAEAMAEQASVTVKEPLPVDDGSATTSPASNAVRLRELELEERRMVREDRKLELEMKRLEVEVEGPGRREEGPSGGEEGPGPGRGEEGPGPGRGEEGPGPGRGEEGSGPGRGRGEGEGAEVGVSEVRNPEAAGRGGSGCTHPGTSGAG